MFGKSLMVDAKIRDINTDKERLMCVCYIESFIRHLIKEIGMKIHDEHIYVELYEGEHHPETLGVSVMAFLTTSTLTCHTTKDSIYLDIFSCKWETDKPKEQVMEIMRSWFNIYYFRQINLIDRI